MIGRPEYTLTLPPPCPTNRDHLTGSGGGRRVGSAVTAAHRAALHMFPHRSRPLRTCSRSTAEGRAAAGVQGDGSPIHSLPRVRRRRWSASPFSGR